MIPHRLSWGAPVKNDGINFENYLFRFYLRFQAKINHEILNSKVFNMEYQGFGKKGPGNRFRSSASSKARSMMNLHNNEAGRRVSKHFYD